MKDVLQKKLTNHLIDLVEQIFERKTTEIHSNGNSCDGLFNVQFGVLITEEKTHEARYTLKATRILIVG